MISIYFDDDLINFVPVTCHQEEVASYIVKVRFTFNFTVSVPPGSPYDVLIDKISKKVNLPPASIILR